MSTDHHLGDDLAAFAAADPASLDALRRAELAAHVQACAACRRAVEETRAIFAALDAVPALEPSAAFDRQVFARIDALESAPSWLDRVRAFFTAPKMAVGAAVAVAAAAAIVVLAPREETVDPAAAQLVALAGDPGALEVAEDLELLEDFELYDNLDVLDELDLIERLEEEEG